MINEKLILETIHTLQKDSAQQAALLASLVEALVPRWPNLTQAEKARLADLGTTLRKAESDRTIALQPIATALANYDRAKQELAKEKTGQN